MSETGDVHGVGCRIQVLTLDERGVGEPLQMLPSPDGQALGGMCLDGPRLWVTGPDQGRGYVHLFELQ